MQACPVCTETHLSHTEFPAAVGTTSTECHCQLSLMSPQEIRLSRTTGVVPVALPSIQKKTSRVATHHSFSCLSPQITVLGKQPETRLPPTNTHSAIELLWWHRAFIKPLSLLPFVQIDIQKNLPLHLYTEAVTPTISASDKDLSSPACVRVHTYTSVSCPGLCPLWYSRHKVWFF